MYRQGDVLLKKVGTIPVAAKPGKRDKGRIVLAYGEVTGHAHVIRARGAEILEHEGTRYIRVPKCGAALEHDCPGQAKPDHSTIDLAPGEYEIVIQREYSPEAIRNVAD